ncbi:hypothetical protein MPR_0976 [Myroides profundi]|nr:hypothetical protein MPR_0976 [Myroides profundi]
MGISAQNPKPSVGTLCYKPEYYEKRQKRLLEKEVKFSEDKIDGIQLCDYVIGLYELNSLWNNGGLIPELEANNCIVVFAYKGDGKKDGSIEPLSNLDFLEREYIENIEYKSPIDVGDKYGSWGKLLGMVFITIKD